MLSIIAFQAALHLFSYFVQPEFNQFFFCENAIAVPVAIAVTMLTKGEIKTKGVIPPEGLEPKPFLAKLSEKGCVFETRITKEMRP